MISHKTNGKFIEPLSDTGFKILFGRESSSDILMGFLNAVLERSEQDPITSITYIDKDKVKETDEERSIAYDIHCSTKEGHRFIVEMQKKPQRYFAERTVFYVSRAITEQGVSGGWDYHFMPVYAVAISQFRLKPDDDRVRVDVGLMDMKSYELFSDCMRLIYIQLPNFHKVRPEECENDFERWVYIIKNMSTMEGMPFVQDIFKRVEQVASVENLTTEERRQYDRDLKFYRDYQNTIAYAKETSFEEGEERGRAEGIVEMISSMFENNLPIETIAKVAKTTVDKVKQILGI